MKKRFKVTPAVYQIFIKDEKILLMRRCNTGYMDGFYGLPSGHKEEGESPTEAVIRETAEEIGVEIGPDDLEYALTLFRKQPDQERLDLFFLIKNWKGEPKNMEPEKCDDLSWFPLDKLPDNIVPYIKEVLQKNKEGVKYCEIGYEYGQ